MLPLHNNFLSSGSSVRTKMESTQGLRGDRLLRMTANKNVEKMTRLIVETTVEFYSPNDWKFRIETTIKCKIETTIDAYSPID